MADLFSDSSFSPSSGFLSLSHISLPDSDSASLRRSSVVRGREEHGSLSPLRFNLLSPFASTAEGYAAFQEDSSADEAESPSKMKRSKGIHVFKKPSFSKKKEKDFKVKEKGPKEDKAKDKKSKDLTAADVVKQWKEKKKKKKPATEAEPVPVEIPTIRPIFGAPLAEAVKRTALYDSIQLPSIFRECVDYIENYGMKCEGIYRVSGIKHQQLSLRGRLPSDLTITSLPVRHEVQGR